jgi:NADPH2:quinone reductase
MLFSSITLQFMLVYELSPADRAAALAGMQSMMKHKVLRHAVGLRLPLADIAVAHEVVETGGAIGSVVVDIA